MRWVKAPGKQWRPSKAIQKHLSHQKHLARMLLPQPQGVLNGMKSSRGQLLTCQWLWMRPGLLGLLGNPKGQGGSVSILGPPLIHYQIHRRPRYFDSQASEFPTLLGDGRVRLPELESGSSPLTSHVTMDTSLFLSCSVSSSWGPYLVKDTVGIKGMSA